MFRLRYDDGRERKRDNGIISGTIISCGAKRQYTSPNWYGTYFKHCFFLDLPALAVTRLDLQEIKKHTGLRITLRVRPSRVAVPGFQRMRTLQRQAHCQLIKHAYTVEKEFYARLLLPANPKCSDSVISSAVALGALSTTESQ